MYSFNKIYNKIQRIIINIIYLNIKKKHQQLFIIIKVNIFTIFSIFHLRPKIWVEGTFTPTLS